MASIAQPHPQSSGSSRGRSYAAVAASSLSPLLEDIEVERSESESAHSGDASDDVVSDDEQTSSCDSLVPVDSEEKEEVLEGEALSEAQVHEEEEESEDKGENPADVPMCLNLHQALAQAFPDGCPASLEKLCKRSGQLSLPDAV